MIGDLRLFIAKLIRQQIICKHDYKTVWRKDSQGGFFIKCRKCEKLK